MKFKFVGVIAFSVMALSCNNADEEPAFLELIQSSGPWTLDQMKEPNESVYLAVSSFSRSVFSFSEAGHYIARYPYNLNDTVYVEGTFAFDAGDRIIDFIDFDTIYHYQPEGSVPRALGTPTDWKILGCDEEKLEVEQTANGSGTGRFMILKN